MGQFPLQLRVQLHKNVGDVVAVAVDVAAGVAGIVV
jgi:hypothetical protein